MMLRIQLSITGINYILKYIIINNSSFKLLKIPNLCFFLEINSILNSGLSVLDFAMYLPRHFNQHGSVTFRTETSYQSQNTQTVLTQHISELTH